MKSIFPILFLFITFSSQAQSKKVLELVNTFMLVGQVHDEFVGFAGETTIQYKSFLELKKVATTQELLDLTKHKSTVVRCYAAWALTDLKYSKLEEVFEYFLKNKEEVLLFVGCIMQDEKISDIIYRQVVSMTDYAKDGEKEKIFYQQKLKLFDELLLSTK